MAQRKQQFLEGEYYHIYNRGNSKQTIFHDSADYERFISLLYIANSKKNFKSYLVARSDLFRVDRGTQLVAIGAWTLMPNHFHLLTTPLVENGISKFMQKLTTGYSMYYNQKYKRTGGLFEGRFKATHADTDEYLKYLYAYIHLNCQKIIGIHPIDSYQYSSFLDYVGQYRPWNQIIDPKCFSLYFKDKESIQKDIQQWILYRSDLAK